MQNHAAANTTWDRSIHSGVGPCSSTRYTVTHDTPYPRWETRERRLIRCVFGHVGIASQVSEANYVIDRESGWNPWATNHAIEYTHDCLGLAQHMRQYWSSRVRALLPRRYFPRWPNVSPYNGRANVWVMARMVKAGGWSPWAL